MVSMTDGIIITLIICGTIIALALINKGKGE